MCCRYEKDQQCKLLNRWLYRLMLDDVPFSMKRWSAKRATVTVQQIQVVTTVVGSRSKQSLGRSFLFYYDSCWQLHSCVQSVESPQGLELRLCQLSSRCPGSGGGQVAMHMLHRKAASTHACTFTHVYLHPFMTWARATLVVKAI